MHAVGMHNRGRTADSFEDKWSWPGKSPRTICQFVEPSLSPSLSPSFVRYHDENERAQLAIKKRGTVLSANEHCSGQIGDSGIPAGQTVKAALFLPLSVRLPPDGFRAEKPTPLDRGPRFLSSVLYGV